MLVQNIILKKSKVFVLGKCWCGCKTDISVRSSHHALQFYKSGHNKTKDAPIGHMVKHSRGYVFIKRPDHHRAYKNGYVLEHIIVWENYNKACLLPWGEIHHIDGIRNNNSVMNLIAMMGKDHHRLETAKTNGYIGMNLKIWKKIRKI